MSAQDSIAEAFERTGKKPYPNSTESYSEASKWGATSVGGEEQPQKLCEETQLPYSGLVDHGARQKLFGWTQLLADSTERPSTPPLLPEMAETETQVKDDIMLLPFANGPEFESLGPLTFGVVDEVVNEIMIGNAMEQFPTLMSTSGGLLKGVGPTKAAKSSSPLPPCISDDAETVSFHDQSAMMGFLSIESQSTNKEHPRAPDTTATDSHLSSTPIRDVSTVSDTTKYVRWTQSEDILLAHAIETEGGKKVNWKVISEVYFRGSRNENQCKGRWKKLRPGVKRSAWSKDEDNQLIRYKSVQGLNFPEIAEKLCRSTDAVRDRWLNVLDPNLDKRPLTMQERQIIFEAQRRYGNKWTTIAKLLPGRSENMVKNCFHNAKMVTRRRMRKAATAAMKQKACT